MQTNVTASDGMDYAYACQRDMARQPVRRSLTSAPVSGSTPLANADSSDAKREAWLRSFARTVDGSIRHASLAGLTEVRVPFPKSTPFTALGDGSDGHGLAWASCVLVSAHGYYAKVEREGIEGIDDYDALESIPLHRLLGYDRPVALFISWDVPNDPAEWVARQLDGRTKPLMPLAKDCLRVSGTVSNAVSEAEDILVRAAADCDEDGVTDARVTISCPSWLPIRQVRDRLLAHGYLSACWPADGDGTMMHWSVWRSVGQ